MWERHLCEGNSNMQPVNANFRQQGGDARSCQCHSMSRRVVHAVDGYIDCFQGDEDRSPTNHMSQSGSWADKQCQNPHPPHHPPEQL
jgi:hypothetical protein